MAPSILSSDIISIGLLLSKGNISITLEDLAGKVTSWQTQNKRIFGVTEDDFINALLMLVLSELNFENDLKDFHKLTFREIIPKILHYNEVYFNDEGEHWMETVEYEDSDLNRFFGLNRNAYKVKMKTKQAMLVFFENTKTGFIASNQVNDFLAGHGITNQVLVDCSEKYKNF
jgi:hypothetical protein